MNQLNIIKLSTLGISLLAASVAMAAPNQEKAFKAMDKDNSGSICIKELTANFEAMAKKSGKEEALKTVGKRAEARLKNEDSDGNGSISMQEFVAAADKKAANSKKKTKDS
jgi:Ca2+-binding EF-hand superfamily protein